MYFKLNFKPKMRDYLNRTDFFTFEYEIFAYYIGIPISESCFQF